MTTMDYFFFYEESGGAVVRLREKRKPSLSTRRACGTWVICEWDEKGRRWCFAGEATLGTINKLRYIGRIPVKQEGA